MHGHITVLHNRSLVGAQQSSNRFWMVYISSKDTKCSIDKRVEDVARRGLAHQTAHLASG